MSSLSEAIQHLERLDQLVYPDNPNTIEAPAIALSYAPIHNLHFSDEKIYSIPASIPQTGYFAKEAFFIAQLRDHLFLGQKFLALLYAYRSVSRGVPQAQNQEQANRPELYKAAYEILKPQVKKMKDLQKFCEETTSLFATVIKTMSSEYREGFASNEFLFALAQMLDLMFIIDMLKNSKASLNNDFSIYKRISSNLKNLTGEVEDETTENTVMYEFLATQNVFSQNLKKKLVQVEGFEELLIDVVNHCAQSFENRLYTCPENKHLLLKAITFALFLIDQTGEDKDITKRKRLRLDRFAKIFKANPVVPFFGDMSMTLVSFFVKSPKLASLRWDHDPNDESVQKNYKLIYHIDAIRQDYNDFLLSFKAATNVAKLNLTRNGQIDHEESASLYELLLKGARLVNDWTCQVLEQSAWKFSNPTNSQINPQCPAEASLYEMAVRYNYSMEERIALVEVIGCIKSLAQILLSVEVGLYENVFKYIFYTLQSFVKGTLKDMLLHAAKKKKHILPLMLHVYSIACEKVEGDALDEPSKKKDAPVSPITPRSCSVALTQLHYIRVILDAVTNEKSKGMQGGFLKEKDFKDNHVTEVMEFLSKSFYFPFMLEYHETIRKASDLSELWYKEFYLELTKQIQFPIEMSLPWILTETILESESADMLEFVLYPLDIYNDATERALHKLNSRFLFDEIEAEVNLCFDQFIGKLSHKVYAEFKTRASFYVFDKLLKKEIEVYVANAANLNRYDMNHNRYDTILKQKRFQLLGRSICISKLVAQYCNQFLRQSLEVAMSRFESKGLTGIVEFELLLECNRLTHSLLSEYMTLDVFDDILTETDEETSLVHYNGRIASQIIQEFLADLVPNYCFNSITQRFIMPTSAIGLERPQPQRALLMHLFGTKHLSAAIRAEMSLFDKFIGAPHFLSTVRILGQKHLGVLLGELTKNVEMILKLNLTPYVKVLKRGMPHSTKLPPFDYGAKGCFDYFHVVLKPIIDYDQLKTGVFQSFKELGNVFAIFNMLDISQKQNQLLTGMTTASLVGEVSNLLETKYEPKLVVRLVLEECNNVLVNEENQLSLKDLGERLDMLYKKPQPLPLFDLFLKKLKKYLVEECRSEWENPIPTKEDLFVDNSTEFYRIWSAVLFAFTVENTNREIYGDGFYWGGASIVYLFEEHLRFNAFDFIRFLNYAFVLDRKVFTQPGQIDMNKFFELSTFTTGLIQDVFEFLEHRLRKEKNL